MKIMSSITHPEDVTNQCICSAEQKGRYLEEFG